MNKNSRREPMPSCCFLSPNHQLAAMAQLIRSAKSGSDWTAAELLAYNITITPTSPDVFFQPVPDPTLDHLDPDILSSPNGNNPNLSHGAARYLGYLDLATNATQESSIDDFAAATLLLLGFDDQQPSTVATRFIIPLTICGESRVAQTDVCLIYRPSTVLLVLVEDKTLINKTSAEAQMVAEAIAAFQYNNAKRESRNQRALEAMTIPCITMVGTTPTFYLVPVTKELSDAVMTGQYPLTQTQVLKCVTVAGHERRVSDGMADIEFRKIALKRFLAFKTLARNHWQHFLS